MYNSKDMLVDEELTFLSYNQTINAEFSIEEILTSDLWDSSSNNNIIKAFPLFNCDEITSTNESDIILESNKGVILQNKTDTIINCISNDTGSVHYYNIVLYCYAPCSVITSDLEVFVYCIVYDEHLNTLNNVILEVYCNNEYITKITTDNNGIGKYKAEYGGDYKFVYGNYISNEISINGG